MARGVATTMGFTQIDGLVMGTRTGVLDSNEAGGPRISAPDSAVVACVMPTDENLMVAQDTRQLLENRTSSISRSPG
jgi:acetate kinase